jgi:hypothetical protein
MVMLSGFMAVRNVESQGYPFIEAAASALAACDELVISDGCSQDRTWEGLLALREVFADRVRLYRDPWPGEENHGRVIATVTNVARRRCAGDYCFQVQANELLPEDSARRLVELPAAFPEVEIFALRYLLLMGPLVASNKLRRRLFRNVADVVAVADAFDVGGADPRRSVPTVAVGLPEPVYRYRAVSPIGYIAKLRGIRPRTRLWATELELAERALEAAAHTADPVASFWDAVRTYLATDSWLQASEGTTWPRGLLTRSDTVPAPARHLVGSWRCEFNHSLAWLAGLDTRGRSLGSPAPGPGR